MNREKMRILAIALLIPFTLLTAVAVAEYGAIGIFLHALETSAGAQVLVDVAIAMVLILCWLIPDAKTQNRNPWPWVVITLTTASFGPLLYLATQPKQAEASAA